MNILYHFRTQGRGPEGVHIAGIAGGLEALGHHVDFSSPTGVDPRHTQGANPFTGGQGGHSAWSWLARRCPGLIFELLEVAYNLAAWWRNWRQLRRRHYGLIYERHAFFLCATAWLARRRKVPLVVEVNELVGDERVREQPFFRGLAERCDRVCFRGATLVTVVSPHLERRVQALGVPASRTLVLPNAVDAADYAQPADGQALRRRHGFGQAVVVGFVGWLVPWHHLEDLMAAVAALAGRYDLRLLIVGDGPLRSDLAGQAASRGIADRVIFAGAVPHQEVPQYTAAMDIAVIPHSNAYRSPIKLFEYMGQGKPVLAPATEPIAMVVRDDANGRLFPPGNMDAFTAGLEALVNDAALRQRLGAQARRDVLAEHTWVRNAEKVLERLSALGVRPDAEGR